MPGRKIWRQLIHSELTIQVINPRARIGSLGFRELDKRGRVERDRQRAYTLRFSMALFGGVALITPVLIMALHPGLKVDLITTSVATVIFALIIAFGARDTGGKDVLAATAAYTAVLVVFVGTSLTPTSAATRTAS